MTQAVNLATVGSNATATGTTLTSGTAQATTSAASSTTGFQLQSATSANDIYGTMTITNITGNTWVASISAGSPAATVTLQGGGRIVLSGTLDRLRLTTVNGTDTFDAGSGTISF